MKIRLLLIDDDERIRATLSSYLRESGFEVITAANVADGKRLNNSGIAVALIDLMLPDGSGLDLLKDARGRFPEQISIMISGAGTISDAVAAVKFGAYDFLEKPVGPEKVELTIRNALQIGKLNRRVEAQVEADSARYQLIGESKPMQHVRRMIEDVAATDSAVLLLGESGTGKEVVAHMIHLQSQRRLQPLIAVNTAAIPQELLESEMFGHEKGAFTGATQRRIGRFEQAGGGSLFLDEIAEMPPHLQAKLLRVLEDFRIERVGGDTTIEVDFRLICATNRNLGERIKNGKFRQDLYFRINVFAIELPPLRQIRDDIEIIAAHHARRLCLRMGRAPVSLSRDLLTALKHYDFPGNVRELRNIIEHLLITQRGDELSTDGLERLLSSSASIPAQLALKDAVAQFESEYIQRILKECAGNMSQAAEVLGLDRSYLYRKLRALGLDAQE